MYKLEYTIKTQSPVIIAKNSGDPNMIATEEYITGSSILGAIADLYIQKKGINADAHRDRFFRDCFIEGAIIFTNAYISEDAVSTPVIPTPFSLHRVKNDIDTKTCYDLLFKDVSEIDKGTAYIGGFCSITGSLIKTYNVKRSLNFHHERDYSKGSTKAGIIFNYESIDAGQTFKGMLLSKEQEQLQRLVETFNNPLELAIGKSRAVQYGKIRIEFSSLTTFSAANTDYDADEDIPLTFISPAIIYNDYGFSTADVNFLQTALGKDVEIKRAFVRSETYEGYNSIWRLKKPSEVCISAGSCMLIKASSEAMERLKVLEFTGIGRRTNEGFGRFVLGLQQNNGELNIESYKEKSRKKPNTPVPKEVKIILKNLIQKHHIKTASVKALEDAEKFSRNNPPTKSLVSKLEAMIQHDGKMYIEELRQTAKNKLENCNNDKETLKVFLQRKRDEIINKNHQKIRIIPDLPDYTLDDEAFKDRLYRQYWLSFFASMRKVLKAKKGGKAQ
ncbi:MAG: hypothetical protein ACK415_05820 [Thermodesulfovibrionales bacterium]